MNGLLISIRSGRPLNCSKITPSSLTRTPAFAKERFELADAYVLGHLNGDEAIEGADNITVVLEIERNTCVQSARLRALLRARHMFGRKRHAVHARAAHLRKKEREPAPARADIEHQAAGFNQELRGNVTLFGKLGVFERLIRRFEIGAAELQVVIEETRIERLEIEAAQDSGLAPAAADQLPQSLIELPYQALRPSPARHFAGCLLGQRQGENVGYGAFIDDESAIHVGFAELQFRIEQHAEFCGDRRETDRDRFARAVAKRELSAACRGHRKVAGANDRGEYLLQDRVHLFALNAKRGRTVSQEPAQRRGQSAPLPQIASAMFLLIIFIRKSASALLSLMPLWWQRAAARPAAQPRKSE